MEHSSEDIAHVVMSLGKWNHFLICFTSFSKQVETLVSTTMVGEGDATTGSSAAIICAPGGSCGAADVFRGLTGVASTTREPETEGLGKVAVAPEDREAGPPTADAREGAGAVEAFFAFPSFFFFILAATVGGSGGEGATGEADGEGLERSDEGRAPDEDDVESPDIFLKKEILFRPLKTPKHSKRLNPKLPGEASSKNLPMCSER